MEKAFFFFQMACQMAGRDQQQAGSKKMQEATNGIQGYRVQETVGAGQGKMAIHVGVGNQVTWKGRKAQGYHRADGSG